MPGPALQPFQFDPNKPWADQTAGRNPYGSYGQLNTSDTSQFTQGMSNPDESGNYTETLTPTDPDVINSSGSIAPISLYGGKYAPVTLNNGKPQGLRNNGQIYYDPKFGWVTDSWNLKDPAGTNSNLIDMAIMSAVGGAGFGAAGAMEGAAGGGGSAVMGQTIPRLAQTGMNVVRTADSAMNPDLPNFTRTVLPSGGNPMAGNPRVVKVGDPNSPNGIGTPNPGTPNYPTDPAVPDNTGNNGNGASSDGSDPFSFLSNLFTGGATAYGTNRLNQNYRGDINHMIDVGTGGLQNSGRAGAQALVKGVYDGSISPDQVLQRVPGLAAISQRGADDIARQMSAHGDADPQSSARMREYVKFNNELTTQAYGQEMNRAMQAGGYNFNPATMAGQGMRAIGDIYGNQRQDLSGLAALLGKNGGGANGGGGLGGLVRSLGNTSAGQAALRALGINPASLGLNGSFSDPTNPSGSEGMTPEQYEAYNQWAAGQTGNAGTLGDNGMNWSDLTPIDPSLNIYDEVPF